MVTEELGRLRKEAMQRLPQQFQADEEQAKQLFPDEALREQAQKRVALGLLIGEVIAKREIELDQDRVSAKLDDIASSYGEQADAVKNYYRQNPQMMQGIHAMVMEQQVVESLLENAAITEKETGFDELLRPENSEGSADEDSQ